MRDGPILAFCRQDGTPAMTCQIRPKIVVCYILCAPQIDLLTLCNGLWLPQQLMLTLLILKHEKITPTWVRGLMVCQLWR